MSAADTTPPFADPPTKPPRLVLRFALYTAAAFAIAAGATLWVAQREAVKRAEGQVRFHARFVAGTILRDNLLVSDFAGPVDALRIRELDDLVSREVLTGGVLRMKMYSPRGVVTYSNEHGLIGTRPEGDDIERAIGTGTIQDVSRLNTRADRDRTRRCSRCTRRCAWRTARHPSGSSSSTRTTRRSRARCAMRSTPSPSSCSLRSSPCSRPCSRSCAGRRRRCYGASASTSAHRRSSSPPRSSSASRRRWRRSASWPAASRTTSTTCCSRSGATATWPSRASTTTTARGTTSSTSRMRPPAPESSPGGCWRSRGSRSCARPSST